MSQDAAKSQYGTPTPTPECNAGCEPPRPPLPNTGGYPIAEGALGLSAVVLGLIGLRAARNRLR